MSGARPGVALVLVGDELLDGRVREANGQWLIERLAALRARVASVRIVGDEVDAIAAAIERAAGESVAVVVSGGLGPTSDDVTREALAKVADEELVLDPELLAALEQRWARRGRSMPESNRRQALRTPSSKPIPNPRGTAPGLLALLEGVPVVLLPGVPAELHAMWLATAEGIVAPLALGTAAPRLRIRTARLPESKLADVVTEVLAGHSGVEPAYLVTEFGVDLLLIARAAQADLPAAARTLLSQLHPHVFEVGDRGLEQVVVTELIARAQTVAVAESCTAGLLGGCLTRVPGSSGALVGGVIAYSNAVKREQLGVSPQVLGEYGAVSEQVARQMACGVRARMASTWGVAITGIAGPDGGSADKPVGTTWVGVRGPEVDLTERSSFPGDRAQNRTWAVAAALDLLRRALEVHARMP